MALRRMVQSPLKAHGLARRSRDPSPTRRRSLLGTSVYQHRKILGSPRSWKFEPVALRHKISLFP